MSNGTCSVDECTNQVHHRKLCHTHILRLKNYGTLELPPLQHPQIPCAVNGCGQPVYQRGKKVCATHKRTKVIQPAECTVEGCTSKPNCHGLCLVHLTRFQRTGTTDLAVRRKPAINHSHGYRSLHLPGHPLADARGYVYEHRHVMYAHLGPGTHPCHHCGNPVTWTVDLEVDHLDYNRSNNDLSNLVPSCHGCNSRRARHRTGPRR